MPKPDSTPPVNPVSLIMPEGSDPACLATCMAHIYRAEMQRMTAWRKRLDTTTHWAIILTTGLTTFALGSTRVPHYIMLLGLAFNTIFMLFEGRRYQHLHHSKWRLSLLEHNYFARQLTAARPVETTWRQQLTADFQKPHFTISRSMGVRLRLRRNYLLLVYFVTVVWLTKVFIHPDSPLDLVEYYQRLTVGNLIPSWFVAATALLFITTVTIASAVTPSEEALEQWSKVEHERFLDRVEDRS